jgi:hypothetical protein
MATPTAQVTETRQYRKIVQMYQWRSNTAARAQDKIDQCVMELVDLGVPEAEVEALVDKVRSEYPLPD